MRPLCLTAVVVAIFAPAAPAQIALQYRVTDLGTRPAHTDSFATGVTHTGQVVGQTFDPLRATVNAARTDPTGGPGWTPVGAFLDRGNSGEGINANGQVVGTANGVGNNRAYRSTPNGQALAATDLGTLPGGTRSFGRAINAGGEVAGGSLQGAVLRAFRSSANGQAVALTDLGTLGGAESEGYGIDALGRVAGYSTLASGARRAFRSSATGQPVALTDLGTLPTGTASEGRAINDVGQVVGFATLPGGVQRAFRSTAADVPPALTDLGTLAGFTHSQARGVNALGVVVGFVGTAADVPSRPFIWSDATGMVDLTTLLDPATTGGLQVIEATGISNTGYISAIGIVTSTGSRRGLLLTPVPEPSALALAGLAAAAGAAAWRRRRARAERPRRW